MRKKIIALLTLSLMLFSVGCSKGNSSFEGTSEIPQGIKEDDSTTETPSGDAMDPALGIVLAGADIEKQIDVTTIRKIELFDLDGKLVEKTFSQEELLAIGNAYNGSMIDDISYIEMLAGYSMDITLDTDQVIHITSYGDENHIVATTKDTTYHLICPEIGKILLTVVQ